MKDRHVNGQRLHAQGITLGYDARTITDDLSVAIPDGSFTVIVGANGCGKSTLLRGLARLLRPRSGSVFLDGELITAYPTKEVARRLGLLPQVQVAPEGITVVDLVSRGRFPHQKLLRQWAREDETAVVEALAATGITDLAPRFVDELSGGQRQRVCWRWRWPSRPRSCCSTSPRPISHRPPGRRPGPVRGAAGAPRLHPGRGAARPQHGLSLRHPHRRHEGRRRGGRGPPERCHHREPRARGLRSRMSVIDDPESGTPLVVPKHRPVRVTGSTDEEKNHVPAQA